MENELVDRSDIKHKINELICNKSRVNILFSNSGLGKSAVLETLLKKDQDTNCSIYVKVDTNNIMDNVACEYEFIGKILNSIKERTYNLSCPKFESIAKFEKFKSAISISLNLGIIGVGVSVPKEYHTHINRVIEAINEIETKINIHIENLEKIDWISLNYIIQIVKSTSNVMFFMECSNDSDKCQIIYNEFENQLLQPKLLILEKLEWNYVSQILCDLNLENNDEAKDEYLKLEGNIKRLIFNNKFKVKENIKIEPEPKLLLDYINICNTHLNIIEIREIIINYDTSMKKLFSMHQIYSYLEILKENDLIIECGKDNFICTNYGKEYSTLDNIDLILQMISVYLIPILENKLEYSSARKIELLISLYIKYSDERIVKLLPYIEKNLLFLKLNSSNIEKIYFLLIKLKKYDVNLMIIITRCFIRLNNYYKAKEVLESFIKGKSNLYKILLSTVLIHIETNSDTERYILSAINDSKTFEERSALYTCLFSLYMRIKSSKFVISFIEKFNFDLLTQIDKMIITKNISIYYDYPIASKMLIDCIAYFKTNNKSLQIATEITLATRETQYGNINNGKDILVKLCDNLFLNNEDLIYINNNSSVIDLLNNTISKNTFLQLNNSYLFCKDGYTHLLICNNLMIYHILNNDQLTANIFANEIERAGFNTYCFDECLHLSFLNLLFFYSKLKDSEKISYYRAKLLELKENCQSIELKDYIDSYFTNKEITVKNKWHYMSQFKFRPAFIGHWIINYFDC